MVRSILAFLPVIKKASALKSIETYLTAQLLQSNAHDVCRSRNFTHIGSIFKYNYVIDFSALLNKLIVILIMDK